MKKLVLALTILAAFLFTPTDALAGKKKSKSKHCSDRSYHHDSRYYRSDDRHYRSYSSRSYTPRYYSSSRSYGYSRDYDRRHYSSRPSFGLSFVFR